MGPVGLASVILLGVGSADLPPYPLASAQAVRDLTAGQLAAAPRVRLAGVVTFAGRPADGDFVVHDHTAGIYVHPSEAGRLVQVGDRVTVEGTADAGGFAPCVRPAKVAKTGTGDLPDPLAYNLAVAEAAWLDAQWVRVCVGVRAVRVRDGYTVLDVFTTVGRATLEIRGEHQVHTARPLVGRSVWASAVVLPRFDAARQTHAPPRLVFPAWPHVAAVPGSERTTDLPLAAVAGHLHRFHPTPAPTGRRVRVTGTVSAVTPDGAYLQAADGGGVRADTAHPLRPGDRATVVGLARLGSDATVLTDVTVEQATAGPPPAPEPLAELVWRPGANARLVRAVGTVTEVTELGAGGATLVIAAGDKTATVRVEPAADGRPLGWPVGATVAVVGVTHPPPGIDRSLAIHVPADRPVEVLALPPPPPYWTTARVGRLFAAAAALAAVSFGWVLMLRHRVKQQTAALTRQFAAEAELQARYKDLFDHARDAVWVTDRDGVVTDLNAAAERLFGRPRAEVAGRPVATVLDPAEAGKVRGSDIRKADAPFELTIARPAGPPAVAEVTGRVLPDGGVQSIARDVTERKQLDERVRQVQKLEAVGRLAGGIAHDFNNMLTVINASAELLANRLRDDPAGRTLAAEVLAAGERAAALTRQLLAFSRQRFVSPKPTDLSAAVGGLAPLLRRAVGERVTVAFELGDALPPVRAEVGLVEQILMNLALNARDAMPQGGTLTVRTEPAAGGGAALVVADTGAGMDDATQARVFEPFFTTKPVGQGTGLGLASVYGIVQTLGGDVRFTSAVGRGTTFAVTFRPAAAGPPDGSGTVPVPAVLRTPPPTATVLLVDDDHPVRQVAEQILAAAGYAVVAAPDGPTALAKLHSHPATIDLLLTDVMMPGMTGRQLADAVRAARPGMKVLYTSGYAGDEVALVGADTDGPWFLPKPFSPVDLTSKVKQILTG